MSEFGSFMSRMRDTFPQVVGVDVVNDHAGLLVREDGVRCAIVLVKRPDGGLVGYGFDPATPDDVAPFAYSEAPGITHVTNDLWGNLEVEVGKWVTGSRV